MRTYLLPLLFVSLVGAATVSAQPANGHWDYFTATSHTFTVADDGAYFWASTWGGLVRFNKADHSSRVHPFRHGRLFNSPSGVPWCIGDSGISYFDGNNWIDKRFRNDTNTIKFFPPHSSITLDPEAFTFDRAGLPVAIMTDGYHPSHIVRFDSSSWSDSLLSPIPVRLHIHGMLIDKSGAIWLAGNENPAGPDYSRFDHSVVVRIQGSNVTTWKQEDGLPLHGYITRDFGALALDSSGNIWASRYEGASKWDGTSWTYYPYYNENTRRPDGPLRSTGEQLLIDPQNVVCFGGDGVSQFDGANWNYFRSPNGPADVNSMMLSGSGKLWVMSDSGAYRFDNGAWARYTTAEGLPSNNCYAAAIDRTGDMLIATDAGVARFAGGVWNSYATPATIPGNQIGRYGNGPFQSTLAVDEKNTLWATTFGDNGERANGAVSYDGNVWRRYTTADGLYNDTTNAVVHGPGNRMWFADHRALTQYYSSFWTNFVLHDSAESVREYTTLACDSSGTLWIPSISMWLRPGPPSNWYWTLPEILQFIPSREVGIGTWKRYGPHEINYFSWNGANCIAADSKDNIWAAGFQVPDSNDYNIARGGFYHFDGTAWKMIELENSTCNKQFLDPKGIICAKDGSVWLTYYGSISSNDGLALGPIVHYDGTNWKHYGGFRDSLPGTFCSALYAEPNGNILAATNFGLVEFDGNVWKLKYPIGPGLMPGNVDAIELGRDSSVWVGTIGSGLAHFSTATSGVPRGATTSASNSAELYPNPVTESTVSLRVNSVVSGSVTISLFDVLGRKLRVLSSEVGSDREVSIPVGDLANGSYFLRVESSGQTQTLPLSVQR